MLLTCSNTTLAMQALLLSTDTLQLMPQANPKKTKTDAGGVTLRIDFTATIAATGQQCSGVAEVCAIAGGTPKKPKLCAPFATTSLSRNALVCT